MEEDRRVLSVQSHVVHGCVGNRAALLPLQLHGFEVDVVNTVQLSNHTGYEIATGTRFEGEQLRELMRGLRENRLLRHCSHVLTGYVGSASLLQAVADVVAELRAARPSLRFVCDPVMGDDGELYVPPELVDIYRERLVPLATVLTPNQTEAELLVGQSINSVDDAFRALRHLRSLGPEAVVMTSFQTVQSQENTLSVLALDAYSQQRGGLWCLRVPRIPHYFSGTGDLMSALLLVFLESDDDEHGGDNNRLVHAMRSAVAAVQSVLRDTVRRGRNELSLVRCREALVRPPVDDITVEFIAVTDLAD